MFLFDILECLHVMGEKTQNDKLYKYSPREVYARLYALENILKHLDEHENDLRKKERMRIQIAKKHIYKSIETGRKLYDESHRNKRNGTKRIKNIN